MGRRRQRRWPAAAPLARRICGVPRAARVVFSDAGGRHSRLSHPVAFLRCAFVSARGRAAVVIAAVAVACSPAVANATSSGSRLFTIAGTESEAVTTRPVCGLLDCLDGAIPGGRCARQRPDTDAQQFASVSDRLAALGADGLLRQWPRKGVVVSDSDEELEGPSEVIAAPDGSAIVSGYGGRPTSLAGRRRNDAPEGLVCGAGHRGSSRWTCAGRRSARASGVRRGYRRDTVSGCWHGPPGQQR
jgi:hypothetical protein